MKFKKNKRSSEKIKTKPHCTRERHQSATMSTGSDVTETSQILLIGEFV